MDFRPNNQWELEQFVKSEPKYKVARLKGAFNPEYGFIIFRMYPDGLRPFYESKTDSEESAKILCQSLGIEFIEWVNLYDKEVPLSRLKKGSTISFLLDMPGVINSNHEMIAEGVVSHAIQIGSTFPFTIGDTKYTAVVKDVGEDGQVVVELT
jgi:hypothetical protein